MPGIFRVIVAFVATGGMLLLYGFVLPLGVMLVALYIVRVWPLAGRRDSSRESGRRTSSD